MAKQDVGTFYAPLVSVLASHPAKVAALIAAASELAEIAGDSFNATHVLKEVAWSIKQSGKVTPKAPASKVKRNTTKGMAVPPATYDPALAAMVKEMVTAAVKDLVTK